MGLRVRNAFSERDRLYKHADRRNSPELLTQFRKKRKELRVTLNQARDKYLANKIAAASDPSQIWRTLANEGLTFSKSDLATKYFSTKGT